MKFKYVGPHDAVEIPSLGVVVEHGHTVEVHGDAVDSLQEQTGVWEHVPDPQRSKAAKKAAATRAANDDAEESSS